MMSTKGLRALFLLYVGGLVWVPPVTAGENNTMSMTLSLNMVQNEQGLSLAPTLLSEHDVTVSFRLLVRSEGAAGSSKQQQSRNLSLRAGEVTEAGMIGLGLRCPYRVEVTAQIWQNERLLLEKKEQMACAG